MIKTIRAALPADITLITSLVAELAAYEKMTADNHATEATLNEALFADVPLAHALIAELDGEPIGIALYFYTYSTFQGSRCLYLEDLYVRETARGNGMGKMLLASLAQIAADQKCARVDWVVLDWNKPSIDFYKSIGAKPKAEWLNFELSGDAIGALAATLQKTE
jgi:GNAT superfamily N-acetyltransferase